MNRSALLMQDSKGVDVQVMQRGLHRIAAEGWGDQQGLHEMHDVTTIQRGFELCLWNELEARRIFNCSSHMRCHQRSSRGSCGC